MLQKTLITMILLTFMFTFRDGAVIVKADRCTLESGQAFIDAGQHKKAIQEFSCVINDQPTEVGGYRGRIEAELMLGHYSNAILDYNKVAALVLPMHPDAKSTLLEGYDARLAIDPDNVTALMGMGFAQWWYFEYSHAIQTFNHLLDVDPDNLLGNLFRGSSRMLSGSAKAKGVADLENALTLAPQNPDVHYIAADAYTYGIPDPQRAFAEASFALNGGLSTPRIHAILATSYNAFGDQASAADHIKTHIDMVTHELVTTSAIASDATFHLDLVAGRTYEIPLPVNAGETISIATSSKDFWDTILVLLAPDGTPILGSDDSNFYFAGFDWTAPATETYKLQVTSFESVSFGDLVVSCN